MDNMSKEELKHDPFTQCLKLRCQEKGLPSAKTITDTLHLAWATEEQEK